MRVERALLEELSEKVFNIGYQGELNHTQVIISCPVMFRDYPDAVASMVVKPPQGDLYPVSLTRDGNDLTWDVSASDVAIPGAGILQLTFTDGEGEEAEIIKTVYGNYSVNASLVANGDAPDPVQSWLDEAGAALATFENEIGDIRKITTATEEDEGLALSPKTVVNGKVTEWEYIDLADPEVVTQAIDDWLDDHPEATTTVEDGAITEAKLNDSLKADLAWQDDVDDVKNALKSEIPNLCDMTTPLFGKLIFRVGNLNSTSGEIDSVSGTRLAAEFVYLPTGATITSTTFEFVPYRYDDSKTFDEAIGGWTRSFSITESGYYRLTARIYGNTSGSVVGKEKIAQDDIKIKPFCDYVSISAYSESSIIPSNYATVLPNADNARKNTVYRLSGFTNGSTSIPSGLPKSTWDESWVNAILMSFDNANDIYSRVQLFITKISIYYRNYQGGSWQSWALIAEAQDSSYTPISSYNVSSINSANYASVLPNADNARKNTVYRLAGFTQGSTSIPSGLPKSKWDESWVTPILMSLDNANDLYARVQLFITKISIYYRNYQGGSWQSWALIAEAQDSSYTPISSYNVSSINSANYASVLPNADNARKNTVYRLAGFTQGSTSIPSGLPKSKWDESWVTPILMSLDNANDLYARVQLFITKKIIYYRNYISGAWQAWSQTGADQSVIRISALGSGDYTSFSEGIIAAFAIPNTTVYVDRGTYNVFDEMKAIMGNDYWDNLVESTQYSYGLPWGNGMKIIGSPGAEIVFDGSQTENDNAWYYFSPLMGKYVSKSDKIVSCEGLTFRVKKFRYAIHIDEGPINNDYTYIIRDCQFYCDNTGNNRTKASDAVGMGASINTTYIVENNYIECEYDSTARDYENLYYHNTNADSPKNKCRISGNYLANVGTIRVDAYGSSENKCLVQVFNNSVGSALLPPNPPTDNIRFLAWNNEVRT